MKRLILMSFFVITLAFMNSANFYGDTVEKIVARVNGQIITLSQVESYYETLNKQKQFKGKIKKSQVLKDLINTEILYQLAMEYHVGVKDKEIQEEINRLRRTSKTHTQQAFTKFLKKKGIYNIELLKLQRKKAKTSQNLIGFIIQNNMVEKPNEKELKRLYGENKENFQENDKIKISHIIIYMNGDIHSYDELEIREELAKSIHKWIKNKEESFEALAKKYSDDRATKNRKELIGWYDKDTLEQFVPDDADEIFLLKKGEVSELIDTGKGWSIFKLIDRKKGRIIPYPEAKKTIRQRILIDKARIQLNNMLKVKKKRSVIYKYY
ncbi:MAG: peptidylprolyl isomerase [bacterium]|nr:MAG: peptidylprolyl isomerase [bacterium]